MLIRISAGGICGTDVAIWKWHEAVVGQYAPSFPLIVGHEFAGTVVASDSPRAAPCREGPSGQAVRSAARWPENLGLLPPCPGASLWLTMSAVRDRKSVV